MLAQLTQDNHTAMLEEEVLLSLLAKAPLDLSSTSGFVSSNVDKVI